ncbi:MAG: 4-(cytidine 5'-diphospho)-2-C-methyl-D-erythritol kinase [Campylobacterota bacterium]|nr:4-(cytidine 5'-diphospho)-2-C-methyl-D-erythritol kinase [Campylobacterota bacterium]
MISSSYRAVAKVNIFLKITGMRDDYHEILSRFMRVESLYDTLYFQEKNSNEPFEIQGEFTCKLEQNTIFKAYVALQEICNSKKLEEFFLKHTVVVEKHIPAFAGLGGGSSDAATFLLMCNEILNLNLSNKQLTDVGLKVGADLPFFISGYSSANVSGVGEIVEEFKEEPLKLTIFTPSIEISTPTVYKSYRKKFFDPITQNEAKKFSIMSSKEILNNLSTDEANDLYKPALKEYPELNLHVKEGYFFSGSGSSFFKEIAHG